LGGLIYKVMESSDVSDVEIEKILNETTRDGWSFDAMQFAMRESSRRPAMVFLTFTRPADAEDPG
jgi:hypothetical protein